MSFFIVQRIKHTVFPEVVVDDACVVPLPPTVLTVFPALLPTPTGIPPPIADGIA